MADQNPIAQGESGDHTILEIDVDEIIQAQQQSDEGYTTEEWSQLLGVPQPRIRKMLKIGIPQGLFIPGIRMAVNWDNRMCKFKVYKWIGETA
jgi:hypothetical protein